MKTGAPASFLETKHISNPVKVICYSLRREVLQDRLFLNYNMLAKITKGTYYKRISRWTQQNCFSLVLIVSNGGGNLKRITAQIK